MYDIQLVPAGCLSRITKLGIWVSYQVGKSNGESVIEFVVDEAQSSRKYDSKCSGNW